MNFRVALDTFRGPLDLLLYLVRKHEIDVVDIPIAPITQQFLEHLQLLQDLDINAVGDFLEMASTLMEIKSRSVLPHGDEGAETLDDPREELVQRLLDYKKFRDAATILDEQSRQWQQRYPRVSNDAPPREVDLAGQPIKEVELWDLVSAFGRIVRDKRSETSPSIVYDDTPMHVYMQRIHTRLAKTGRVALSDLLEPGMHKSTLVGFFLAILELVRHHSVWTEQNETHGEIWVLRGEQFDADMQFAEIPAEMPDAEPPSSKTPDAETPSGETPDAEAPSGDSGDSDR